MKPWFNLVVAQIFHQHCEFFAFGYHLVCEVIIDIYIATFVFGLGLRSGFPDFFFSWIFQKNMLQWVVAYQISSVVLLYGLARCLRIPSELRGKNTDNAALYVAKLNKLTLMPLLEIPSLQEATCVTTNRGKCAYVEWFLYVIEIKFVFVFLR